jgi:hypothetical protein
VIIRKIITFKAAFVCEGIPVIFNKEAKPFGISLFLV